MGRYVVIAVVYYDLAVKRRPDNMNSTHGQSYGGDRCGHVCGNVCVCVHNFTLPVWKHPRAAIRLLKSQCLNYTQPAGIQMSVKGHNNRSVYRSPLQTCKELYNNSWQILNMNIWYFCIICWNGKALLLNSFTSLDRCLSKSDLWLNTIPITYICENPTAAMVNTEC